MNTINNSNYYLITKRDLHDGGIIGELVENITSIIDECLSIYPINKYGLKEYLHNDYQTYISEYKENYNQDEDNQFVIESEEDGYQDFLGGFNDIYIGDGAFDYQQLLRDYRE